MGDSIEHPADRYKLISVQGTHGCLGILSTDGTTIARAPRGMRVLGLPADPGGFAALGYHQSCSTLESWASDGMAPRPIRVSLGRKGSTSIYPAGATEQYAVVAEVMQRDAISGSRR